MDGERPGCDGGGITVWIRKPGFEETDGVDDVGGFGVKFPCIRSVQPCDGHRKTDQQ